MTQHLELIDAGSRVDVELDARAQRGTVVKVGRSTIHVRVGRRVWRMPPAKVLSVVSEGTSP